jgi:hypothetical protein
MVHFISLEFSMLFQTISAFPIVMGEGEKGSRTKISFVIGVDLRSPGSSG